MNIIIGKRGSGKTTELIRESAEEKIYILTATKRRAREILEAAKRLNLTIPHPITVDEYLSNDTYRGPVVKRGGILIDDADYVLQYIFNGVYIDGITLTDQHNIRYLGERSNLNEKD